MKIFAHRVNTLEKLARVPQHFGVEIDIRGWGERMLLNHDPLKSDIEYVDLETFLEAYVDRGLTGGIILNLKEAGYEQVAMDLVESYGISDYFLLDVEFPYLYRATRKEGVRKIAVRYSEAEPIEAVEAQIAKGKPLLDWVWIDTNTKLPLDSQIVRRLKPFKTALVCPERWGRPDDIHVYIKHMKALGFTPDTVMTHIKYTAQWEKAFK